MINTNFCDILIAFLTINNHFDEKISFNFFLLKAMKIK